MKKVIVIGASGSLVPYVVDAIHDAEITLFVRNRSRLDRRIARSYKVIEGDATAMEALRDAIVGQDIVYVNLAGDLCNNGHEHRERHETDRCKENYCYKVPLEFIMNH